jgi:magnesium-transporting ATPase (P-type)
MQSTLVGAIVFATLAALYWATMLGLLLSYIFETDGNDDTGVKLSSTANLLRITLSIVAFFGAAAAYIGWEAYFGSAFSYFYPLHGAERVAATVWRVGVVAKAIFMALLLVVLSQLLTIAFSATFDDLLIMTPVRTLTLLLIPVSLGFPLGVLAVYAFTGQLYRPPPTHPLAKYATKE